MPDVLMECGHVAGEPVCAICIGINEGASIVAKHLPDISSRQARCSCGTIVASSYSLAFFEFTGEGSRPATEICATCRYAEVAHVPEIIDSNKFVCDKFVPHGAWDYDRFYCGHAGWD